MRYLYLFRTIFVLHKAELDNIINIIILYLLPEKQLITVLFLLASQ